MLGGIMIIDHVGFGVSDYEAAKTFYIKALAPLGIALVMETPAEINESGAAACGFGRDGKPEFWLGAEGKTSPSMHVAFLSPDREGVNRFYWAAMEAGGKDNGAPGLRPHYHANYYAAFIHDPDGHNIEAVCHQPE
jgi:catechol 2,3-dioxygenase-like lactoylglutathione lyase family enzyme